MKRSQQSSKKFLNHKHPAHPLVNNTIPAHGISTARMRYSTLRKAGITAHLAAYALAIRPRRSITLLNSFPDEVAAHRISDAVTVLARAASARRALSIAVVAITALSGIND